MDRGEGLLNMRQRTTAPGSGGAEEAGADRRVSNCHRPGCGPPPGLGPQPTDGACLRQRSSGDTRSLRKGEGRAGVAQDISCQVHQKEHIWGRHLGPLTVADPQCKEDQCFSSIFA